VGGGEPTAVPFTEARMVNGSLVITFNDPMTYNPGGSIRQLFYTGFLLSSNRNST
jgi:hypothetical protein